MANSAYHKAQAEALIIQVNKGVVYEDKYIALAQVHATLATVPDEPLDPKDFGPI